MTPDQEVQAAPIGEFHWKGGILFKRMEDGSVRIRQRPEEVGMDWQDHPFVWGFKIDKNSWDSIVHEMAIAEEVRASKINPGGGK